MILCDRVTPYFDQQTQAAGVESVYRFLNRGDYLFGGRLESLCNLQHRFASAKPTGFRT